MKKLSRMPLLLSLIVVFILSGCSRFMGLREPLYDGRPIERDDDAIAIYNESGEIVGDEKEYYFRYPFSEDIYQGSLDYPEDDPVLLEEGEYIIGEDIPAGRATLLGNQSVFASENYEVHLGNLIIRDETENIYFENLFHAAYGQLVTQVDLIPGHTIEIIGKDPEITVFYSSIIPEDPYMLMDPPQLLINLDQLIVQQPLTISEEDQSVVLTAGIYEVGVHIEPGAYEVADFIAVHSTAMYLFQEGEEPRVFELVMDEDEIPVEELDQEDNLTIQLQAGDKIYLELVSSLVLQRVDND